jgi:ABC-type nitrate/sulfonate/bicarbonate transport system substrate-binding protein
MEESGHTGGVVIARLILLLVFSLSWLPAPSAWAAAAAPQLPRVRIAYSSISSIFAGLWVAKEAGVFEKYGLRGELLYIGAGSVAVQAMMGGEVEVVAGAGNAVVSAILQGAPLVSVGSVANLAAMTLWVQPEIKRPEQLQGKVLGISRHGSTTHYLTLVALEKLGLKDKVKLQALGGAPETDASFRAGMIAGAVRSVKPDPKAFGLADLAELKIPFPMDLFAVNREYYKGAAKNVEAMLKAYAHGVALIKTRKEFAVNVMRKYLRKTEVEDSYEYAARYLERVPRVDPTAIQTVLAWEGKSDIAPTRFYDNSIIDRLVHEGFIDNLYKGGL